MTIKGNGYAVTDNQRNAIFGVGETADEAWADFLAGMNQNDLAEYEGDPWDDDSPLCEHFVIRAATKALRQAVDTQGGDIEFESTGVVLHLPEEAACCPNCEGGGCSSCLPDEA